MSGSVGVAPGTTTVRLPDGRVMALADWRDQPFYGTIELEVGDTSPILAFSTGLSQNIPGGTRPSTEFDTNLQRDGNSGLQKDTEFLLYGWGIKMVRATRGITAGGSLNGLKNDPVTTLATFSDPIAFRTFFEIDRRTFFQYRYNRKSYVEGAIQDFPQGHGIFLTSTQSNVDFAQNGFPSPRDRVALVIPVHHREELSFTGLFQPIVPESFVASGAVDQTGGQAASDSGVGGQTLCKVDIKLYTYGLRREVVV